MKTTSAKQLIRLVPFLLCLSLFGCNSGGTIDYSTATPPSNNTQHSFTGHVIIIGAGAAGLAAASRLESSGISYTILEATGHYGGRVQKNTTFADFPIDLGAEWIHADKGSLNQLLGKQGDEPEQAVIHYAPMDVLEISAAGEISKVSSAALNIAYAAYPEYKFKDTTWYDYLDTNFARLVKDKIVYHSPVTAIDYRDAVVTVTTENGDVYQADKVISTVSIGVLKANAIRFIPELPARKQQAITSTAFYSGLKLFIKFSEDFYADAIDFDTEYGVKHYYDLAYGKVTNDHIVALLSTGKSAEFFNQLGSEQEVLEAALLDLDNIYQGRATAAYTGEYILKNWGQHTYTLGTWTDDVVSQYEAALVDDLENKVYFAGETFDLRGARSTVHGAILSGYDAVQSLLQESSQ